MARREQVESEERSVEEREGGGGLSSVSEIIRSPLNMHIVGREGIQDRPNIGRILFLRRGRSQYGTETWNCDYLLLAFKIEICGIGDNMAALGRCISKAAVLRFLYGRRDLQSVLAIDPARQSASEVVAAKCLSK